METFNFTSLLLNLGAFTGIAAIIGYLVRHSVAKYVDFRFSEFEERSRLARELEKAQALLLIEKRNTIYPEVLEVVYRLRNCLRDISTKLPADRNERDDGEWALKIKRWGVEEKLKQFDPALHLLTENLYKYRAFVDENVFQMLHTFKRKIQDAGVHLDRITRSEGQGDFRSWSIGEADYAMSVDLLAETFAVIDKLYYEITVAVKAMLEKHVPKV